MGGGFPIGAFISSWENMNKLTFNPKLGHITTFGGHPREYYKQKNYKDALNPWRWRLTLIH